MIPTTVSDTQPSNKLTLSCDVEGCGKTTKDTTILINGLRHRCPQHYEAREPRAVLVSKPVFSSHREELRWFRDEVIAMASEFENIPGQVDAPWVAARLRGLLR